MSATWADFAAALAEAPSLPGALCRGQHHLFDGCDFEAGETRTEAAERHAVAARICSVCPELAPCRAWSGQFSYPLAHVIGGRVPAARRRTTDTPTLEES
ncbi:hypothetical protein HQ308_16880 [Rhodococcus sp. BP-241]|uniref:hypothetical protein n=1 Tax=Rhodococcus sp. BP-241 TaxID=2739441 RepID=UPI001C9B2680|nr:hypothetical protein [Rhodococcus sp. BP-241]MBY6708477.1 hypothetical protein [Rhodococcus sp. BP-241]